MAKAVLDEIITEDMTPYDKEKAVYDWMTSELSYDTGILQVIPQTTADCDNPYGVLKYHNAVCVGYATTFRLLMQMMEIPCMVVHSTDEFHSWNLVKLDDAWYHVDIYSDQNGGSYANFNMNDELAGMSHDWDRTFFPAATSLDYNYAYQNRVTVEDRFQVPQMVRKATDERSRTLFLAFPGIDEAGVPGSRRRVRSGCIPGRVSRRRGDRTDRGDQAGDPRKDRQSGPGCLWRHCRWRGPQRGYGR